MKILLYANSPEKAARILEWTRRLSASFPIEPALHRPAEPDGGERAALERLRSELAEAGTAAAAVVEAGPGSTEEALAAEVARGDYSMVLLAPAGRRGVVRLIYGSLVGQVVRRVRSSVLVVREGAVPPRRILVCVSGSRHSLTNVRMAARLGTAFDASLTLLMVISQLPVEFAGRHDSGLTQEFLETDHALAAHMRAAEELMRRMGGRGSARVREGLVIEQILDEVESAGHDMVVLGTHQAEDYDPMYEDLTAELVTRLERTVLVVGQRADLP